MGATLTGGLLRLRGQGCGVPHRIGKCQQIVRARLLRSGGHGKAHDFPAPRDGEGVRVLLAQIVAMRLRVGGQRTQDRRRIRVNVRQRSYR